MKKSSSGSVSASIMKQIKSGEVKMKPRVYHTLLYAVSIGAIIAAGVTVAYLSSIVFFWIRIQTAGTMAWGARSNLSELVNSFPWWTIPLSVMLVALAVWLVRGHGRLYRHKISTLVAVIVAGSLLLGMILSAFGVGNHTPNQTPGPGRGMGPRAMQLK